MLGWSWRGFNGRGWLSVNIELCLALAISLASGYLVFGVVFWLAVLARRYHETEKRRRAAEMSRRIWMRQTDEWDE